MFSEILEIYTALEMLLKAWLICTLLTTTSTFHNEDTGITTKNAQIKHNRGKLTIILLFSPDILLQELTTLGKSCENLSTNTSLAFKEYFDNKIQGSKSQIQFQKCLMGTDTSISHEICKKIDQLNFIASKTQIQFQALKTLNIEIENVFESLHDLYKLMDTKISSDLFTPKLESEQLNLFQTTQVAQENTETQSVISTTQSILDTTTNTPTKLQSLIQTLNSKYPQITITHDLEGTQQISKYFKKDELKKNRWEIISLSQNHAKSHIAVSQQIILFEATALLIKKNTRALKLLEAQTESIQEDLKINWDTMLANLSGTIVSLQPSPLKAIIQSINDIKDDISARINLLNQILLQQQTSTHATSNTIFSQIHWLLTILEPFLRETIQGSLEPLQNFNSAKKLLSRHQAVLGKNIVITTEASSTSPAMFIQTSQFLINELNYRVQSTFPNTQFAMKWNIENHTYITPLN